MERFYQNIYTCCLREEHSLAGSCCSNCHIGIYMKDQAGCWGSSGWCSDLGKTAYLPYARSCVSLKWAYTASSGDFAQWEIPLLGSASTLVYIWIWHWNIHSSAQACMRACCRRVSIDTSGGSCLKKTVEALPKPLKEFSSRTVSPPTAHMHHVYSYSQTPVEGTEVIFICSF